MASGPKLRQAGTPAALRAVGVLDIILRDEVGHVAIGNRWYRWLCGGDGLPTDIRGANARGLDVLFVANGIHGAETVGPSGLDLRVVSDLLRQEGLTANCAMADMVW